MSCYAYKYVHVHNSCMHLRGFASHVNFLPCPTSSSLYLQNGNTFVHVHVQYRSRGTYTRASSASDCTREFESVKLDKRRSSTRTLERSHSSTGALALERHSKPAPLALERSHTYRSTARHVALVYTRILSW